MSDYKICPMKATAMPLVMHLEVDGEKPTVKIMNRCMGNDCAWYDATKEQCAVLTIAKASRT